VIHDGIRSLRNYRKGPGVCAALLIREGFKVVSQRDFRTLGWIFQKLVDGYLADADAIDQHETEWYRSYFGG
jgi:hypothetical protein